MKIEHVESSTLFCYQVYSKKLKEKYCSQTLHNIIPEPIAKIAMAMKYSKLLAMLLKYCVFYLGCEK